MKKFICAFALLGGGLLSGHTENFVRFQNHGPIFWDNSIDRRVYFGEVGGSLLVGTNYAAQLWYLLPGLPDLLPVPDATRLFRPSFTTLGGTWNTAPTANILLPGTEFGHGLILQIRVWDIQQFPSYEAALAGGGETGASMPFGYTVPFPGASPTAYTLDGLRAFAVVPEPSTMMLFGCSLAAFGVGSACRRKRARPVSCQTRGSGR